MKAQNQLELERQEPKTVPFAPRNESGVKTVLLHIQNDKALDSRLEAAVSLARSCAAHLSCLHVTPIQAYVAFDSFGGVFVMNDVIKTLDEEEAALRSKVETKLQNEDIRWDYAQVTGDIVGQLVSHAALADLVVTGRAPHRADFAKPAIGIMGDLLYRSRTPILIAGDEAVPLDPAGVALIAWNGSYEAANAVRASIGLLKIASEVRVLHVEEATAQPFHRSRLLEFLSRHDIHAELRSDAVPDAKPDMVSGSILAEALNVNAAYVVMGGYSHNRVAEYVFGGVTRAFLGNCPIPILMAH